MIEKPMVDSIPVYPRSFLYSLLVFGTLSQLPGDEKEMKINHCSESDCPKNDKRGSCTIDGCILISPIVEGYHAEEY